MELIRIKQLLEKYLEGETSLKEEQTLKQYFSSGKVAPELEEYKLLFGFFKEERQQVPSQKVQLKTQKSHKRKYLRWTGVAAAVAIIVSVFLFRPEPTQQKQWNEIKDPQLALKRTKQVLNTIAQQMNTGKSKLVYLYEVENTASKIIEVKPEN